MSKQERIKAVFDYLHSHGCIHTQKDLAAAIGSTPPNISKMLKGDPKVLTDNICRRIHKEFKMISADWLIDGTGEMVIIDSNSVATDHMPVPDYSSLINATIAAMDSTIASLKREIASKDASLKAVLEAKDEAIASMKRELETKDALVKSLRQQVSDLNFTLSELKEKSKSSYQFPLGIAEDGSSIARKNDSKPPIKFPSNRK